MRGAQPRVAQWSSDLGRGSDPFVHWNERRWDEAIERRRDGVIERGREKKDDSNAF